ncbi:MAG: LUD domain-containing protein [Chitinophagaceae bacterium]|nr:LUD domain-containing protein [Chitinophagaceae bacterium]
MNSRNNILKKIADNKPSLEDLPQLEFNGTVQYADKPSQFMKALTNIGADVLELSGYAAINTLYKNLQAAGKIIINTIPEIDDVNNQLPSLSAENLAGVEIAFIKGLVAVAENGALWVTEEQMQNRLLPFICEHLYLVIERENIVDTMHQAYQKIDTASSGFGVFIAGPSKTADIEQSLVIGAHGPKKTTIIIIN